MSRVASLGLHTPTALPFCITEKLLPDPPPPDSYIWTTGLPHEELLVAGNAVIWSQGGIIRRVFRYDVEKEPVVQAVLTWFPSDDDPLDAGGQISDPDDDASESGGYISEGSDRNKRKPEWEDDFTAKKRPNTWNSKTRSYATQLGSFPDARGGRTVGGGVGDAGLSIADGDEVDEKNVGGMARALVVFLKTRAFAYFLSGTMHVVFLPFEIQHAVPAARGLILERKINITPPPPSFATGNSYSLRPPVNTKDTPRLFTLIDPLSEVGLVMTTVNTPSTENLLFISPSSELVPASGQGDPSRGWSTSKTAEVLFAVTYNAEKFQFTVWQVRYTHREPSMIAAQRAPSISGSMSARRRSSFGPGTGATTPVAGGGPGSIVSSGTLVGRPSRDSLNANDASSLNVLGEDFQTTGRRSSRRISSMMARADLSGNHEASHRFSDVSTSLSASFNAPPPPPQNTMIVDDEPVDDLLEELNMGSLGMEDMGAYVGEGLNHELVMHKIESFPARLSNNIIPREDSAARVFTLRGPSSMSAATLTQKEPPGQTVVMYIMNRNEATLLQLTFQIQVHSAIPKGYPRRPSTKYGPVAMGYTAALIDIQKRDDVLDAIKIQDGGLEKVLILTDDNKFLLYAPRGPAMDIILPPTMARWNPNVIGEDGSRRGSRKKEFARTLSTTPDRYQMLQYSEPGGRVSVIDGEFVSHRINIVMAPREVATKSCLETLRAVMGAEFGAHVGEGLWSAWMTVAKWLQTTSEPEATLPHSHDSKGMSPADEWEAFVVTLFILAVPMLPEPKPQARRKSAFVRSVSMVAEREWEDLATHEGDWGSAPEYLRDPAWQWMLDEQEEKAAKHQQALPRGRGTLNLSPDGRLQNKFITDCVSHARQLMKSPMGDYIQHDCFGKGPNVEHLQKTALAFSLVALQLLREEWKLDIAMEGPGRRLCPVLRQMAWWLGWTTWGDDFMLEDIEMAGWAYDESHITGVEVPEEHSRPPDIFQWLISCLKGESPAPFMVLQDMFVSSNSSGAAAQHTGNPFSPPRAPPLPPAQKAVFARLTPRTQITTTLYTTMATPGAVDVDVVEKMVQLKVDLAFLQRLPEGVGVPLREAIAKCQEQPPTTWGVELLELIGRKDLRMLIDPAKSRKETTVRWQHAPNHEAIHDIHIVCQSTYNIEDIGSYDPMAERDRQAVAQLLFKDDRRLHEAARLLQSSKNVATKCIPQPHWNEQEKLDRYKAIANHTAMRTLAVPSGRGLFHFSARIPLLTEKFPISGFNLACIIKPVNTTVSAEKSHYTEEKVGWAFFHAGVAAGVSISRDAKEIDTSWIVFNRPTDLTNRHGGFLLGLGLNGHLKNIAKWHAFNYLTPKHTMTSIGLLLGISASFFGTMDTTITKLLSVHVTRLLPPGSAELNISPLTQTAGIMGIGLLYANTQHRRMSEVMLSEIEHVEEQESCVPTDNLRNEGYRLAAGFALGFINLGAGNNLRGLHDMQLVERLLAQVVGSKNVSLVHIMDKATAGATIALALIYMKTNEETLARKLDVPDTAHLLDYVRPDMLLLRTVARNIVLWDRIEGTAQWIQNNLRPFHQNRRNLADIKRLDSEDLPFYNILAGLCFSVALKYAGSGDESVRDVLVHHLDEFIRLCSLQAISHDQKLARTALRISQDLLALSCATVMAGTGDITVFRRLRRLHSNTGPDVPYGSHFASHLAMGVIFLGNGAFTFGTSNIAVAALMCAFYPLFPTTPLDNKSHLQAFRHFWVLAVENRCIVPRDVETFRPCQIPIAVTLKSGEELRKIAPCLLPELDTIATVTTTSPEHWTVVLDFANSRLHREAFERSQSIYVHRRSAHASQSTVFQAALQALDDVENLKAPLEWIGQLPAFAGLDKAEKALVIREGESGGGEAVDERLELEEALKRAENRSRIRGVAVVTARREGQGGLWIGDEVTERLRAGVWVGDGV